MEQGKSIETLMARVEEILAQLGDSSVTLDRSLALYTEGVALSQECLERIKTAQQVVEQHSTKED